MTVIDAVIKNGYSATDAQIEQLSRDVVAGERAGVIYLRVMVCRCQKAVGARGRITKKAQLAAINKTHEAMLPVVQKAFEGQEAEEVNRRSRFATSVASTLRRFVVDGGNLRSLDVSEVTKASLTPEPKGEGAARTPQRAITRGVAIAVRGLDRIAKKNPRLAVSQLEKLIARLQAKLKQYRPITKRAAAAAQEEGRARMH